MRGWWGDEKEEGEDVESGKEIRCGRWENDVDGRWKRYEVDM